jgi:hypothetical protein
MNIIVATGTDITATTTGMSAMITTGMSVVTIVTIVATTATNL